jgi:hypothetical protein
LFPVDTTWNHQLGLKSNPALVPTSLNIMTGTD